MFPSMKTLCLLMLFSCIVRECKGGDLKAYGTPNHCKIVDCPLYSVIHTEKEFEIRNYHQALWVTSPSVQQSSIMGGFGEGSLNLTFYYHHENDQGVNIMTTGNVVMMDIINSTYTINFYVPQKYQNGGLPKPLNPAIKQEKYPTYKFAAVRRVDGDLNDDLVAAQLNLLKKNLQGTAYQRAAARNQFTFVLYDTAQFSEGYELIIWFD